MGRLNVIQLSRNHHCYQANVEVKAEFNHYNANTVSIGLKTGTEIMKHVNRALN